MHRLIYVSRSITRFPHDLKAILESSRRNNARVDITGALCFLDGVYCQYLEGERADLEALYQVLLADSRHRDVKLIELCSIDQRVYANWAMALVTWTKQTRALFKALNLCDPVDLYAITTDHAAITFNVLAQSPEWMELAPPENL